VIETEPSYDAKAYGVIRRLFRRTAGIMQDDPEAAIREKLGAAAAMVSESDRGTALAAFEQLFGLTSGSGLDGDAFQRELLDAMRAWWRRRFQDQPAVLVFDDLHWCDSASVSMLKELMQLAAEVPVVFLCAMRVERAAPAWQIGRCRRPSATG
jgi:predicted ATPase